MIPQPPPFNPHQRLAEIKAQRLNVLNQSLFKMSVSKCHNGEDTATFGKTRVSIVKEHHHVHHHKSKDGK